MLCSLLVHLAAIHIGFSSEYRTMVPGAGVECEVVDSISLAIGTYQNSDGDQSRYAIGIKDFKLTSSLSAGFFIGAVDGYKWRRNGNWDIFGGVKSSWAFTPQWKLQLQLVPGAETSKQSVISIGFSYTFGE